MLTSFIVFGSTVAADFPHTRSCCLWLNGTWIFSWLVSEGINGTIYVRVLKWMKMNLKIYFCLVKISGEWITKKRPGSWYLVLDLHQHYATTPPWKWFHSSTGLDFFQLPGASSISFSFGRNSFGTVERTYWQDWTIANINGSSVENMFHTRSWCLGWWRTDLLLLTIYYCEI